jgi:hypothetical protein
MKLGVLMGFVGLHTRLQAGRVLHTLHNWQSTSDSIVPRLDGVDDERFASTSSCSSQMQSGVESGVC